MDISEKCKGKIVYRKEYPFFEIANKGIEEHIKNFLQIMYELWVRNDKKEEFATEVNRRLRKANQKFQISGVKVLADTEEGKAELVCGNGKIIEEHDNIPGFCDHDVWISCDECSKKYTLDTSRGVRGLKLVEKE